MPNYLLKPITVLGLGLIGGSLFQRLVRLGHPVTGYDVSAATRDLASEAALGSSGRVVDTLTAALAEAELAVIATPMNVVPTVLEDIGRTSYQGLLTDVSSSKSVVDTNVRALLPNARWVGGHPMAGTQYSGFAASTEDLLPGCAWALCLEDDTELADWWSVARWITELGCRVVPMTASDHDQAVARISHVPHAVAAALVAKAAEGGLGALALSLGAGSFRDGTRVMQSNLDFVTALCTNNAAAVAAELESLSVTLSDFAKILTESDATENLRRVFESPHNIRSSWPQTDMTSVTRPVSALKPQDIVRIGHEGGWITEVADEDVISVKPKITQKTAN